MLPFWCVPRSLDVWHLFIANSILPQHIHFSFIITKSWAFPPAEITLGHWKVQWIQMIHGNRWKCFCNCVLFGQEVFLFYKTFLKGFWLFFLSLYKQKIRHCQVSLLQEAAPATLEVMVGFSLQYICSANSFFSCKCFCRNMQRRASFYWTLTKDANKW